eukprot:331823-Alexandrium_andersonii.AAC.1
MTDFARDISRERAWRGPFAFCAWAVARRQAVTLVMGNLAVSLPDGVDTDGVLHPAGIWDDRA